MRSVTLIGGTGGGLQAAVAKMAVPRHPAMTTDLIEFDIPLLTCNVTEKQPRRDRRGCDAAHDLAMFLAGTGHRNRRRRHFGRPPEFDPAAAPVYRSELCRHPKPKKKQNPTSRQPCATLKIWWPASSRATCRSRNLSRRSSVGSC